MVGMTGEWRPSALPLPRTSRGEPARPHYSAGRQAAPRPPANVLPFGTVHLRATCKPALGLQRLYIHMHLVCS